MIGIDIILLLKVIAIGFLVSNFQPIQWLLDELPNGHIKWNLQLLFGCMKCFSFWFSLIWIQNIWFSIFVFFIISALMRDDKYIYYTGLIKNSINNWYKSWRLDRDKKHMEKIIKRLEENEL